MMRLFCLNMVCCAILLKYGLLIGQPIGFLQLSPLQLLGEALPCRLHEPQWFHSLQV